MDDRIELQEKQYLEAEEREEIRSFLNPSPIVAFGVVEPVPVDTDVPF